MKFTLIRSTCPLVTLNQVPLPVADNLKYLGLHIDKKLIWESTHQTKRTRTQPKIQTHTDPLFYLITNYSSTTKPSTRTEFEPSNPLPTQNYQLSSMSLITTSIKTLMSLLSETTQSPPTPDSTKNFNPTQIQFYNLTTPDIPIARTLLLNTM